MPQTLTDTSQLLALDLSTEHSLDEGDNDEANPSAQSAASSPNPASNQDQSHEALSAAHTTWLQTEALRRLLLACFILDTHRSTFFHQPASRPLPPSTVLPRPCINDLWIASSVEFNDRHSAVQDGRGSPTPTPFKVNLDQALSLHLTGRVQMSVGISDGSGRTGTAMPRDSYQQQGESNAGNEETDVVDTPMTNTSTPASPSSPPAQALTFASANPASAELLPATALTLTIWTLHLASTAPVRALLTVAAEGSYACVPVSDAEWTAAKQRLRAWALSAPALDDLRTAGRVLAAYFSESHDSEVFGVGLELDWCLYIAALVVWGVTGVGLNTSAGSGAGGSMSLNMSLDFPVASSLTGSPLFGKGKQPLSPTASALSPTAFTSMSPPRSIPGSAHGSTPPGSASSYQLHFLPAHRASHSLGGGSSSSAFPSPTSFPAQGLASPSAFAAQPPTSYPSYGYAVQQPGADVLDPAALQHVLQTLSVEDAGRLGSLRGRHGAAPVLQAVRSIVARGGLNLMKGLLLAEAEGVLAGLVDGEEGRRGVGLVAF